MRNKFDEQLELLKKQMIQMGALCEGACDKSADRRRYRTC